MTAIEQSLSGVCDAVTEQWTRVCAVGAVRPDRGVAVLVGDEPIAVFRLSAFDAGAEEWFAVSHIDPATGAPVMARGLVGTLGEPPAIVSTVASPLHKQRYDLRTGKCLDSAGLSLRTFRIRLHDGFVEVGAYVTPT